MWYRVVSETCKLFLNVKFKKSKRLFKMHACTILYLCIIKLNDSFLLYCYLSIRYNQRKITVNPYRIHHSNLIVWIVNYENYLKLSMH